MRRVGVDSPAKPEAPLGDMSLAAPRNMSLARRVSGEEGPREGLPLRPGGAPAAPRSGLPLGNSALYCCRRLAARNSMRPRNYRV